MENWLTIFLLLIFGALANLAVAFVVLRAMAGLVGIPHEANTPRRALVSLVTIMPVAGVAGGAFFIIPFWGPIFGTIFSGYVAATMFGQKYEVGHKVGAKVMIPTILAIYVVTGTILYFAIDLI